VAFAEESFDTAQLVDVPPLELMRVESLV